MINPVNNLNKMISTTPTNKDKKNNITEDNKINNSTESVTLELSNSDVNSLKNNTGIYKPNISKMNQLLEETEKSTENLRNLVNELFQKQGLEFEKLLEKNEKIEIPEELRLEAERLVSEDGEFGIEKVSDRIIEFAKAVSGGDPSKIDELKEAVEKGFEEAEKILGELPEISSKTYDRIMEKFDDWESESNQIL
jgi:hypothetical protein